MTKHDISRKVLDLLDCDYDDIIDAIYRLAREIEFEADDEEDDED